MRTVPQLGHTPAAIRPIVATARSAGVVVVPTTSRPRWVLCGRDDDRQPARVRGPGPGTAQPVGVRLLRGRLVGRADHARQRGRVRPPSVAAAGARRRFDGRPVDHAARSPRLPAGRLRAGGVAGPGPPRRRARAGPDRRRCRPRLLPVDLRQPFDRAGRDDRRGPTLVPAVRPEGPQPVRIGRPAGCRRRLRRPRPDRRLCHCRLSRARPARSRPRSGPPAQRRP